MLQKLDKAHMNRLYVADYLNNLDPEDFHMGSCDSCICGHINRLAGSFAAGWNSQKDYAARYLGIDDSQANDLFAPGSRVYGDPNSPHETPDPRDAARVLRYLAATDMVDWSVGKR